MLLTKSFLQSNAQSALRMPATSIRIPKNLAGCERVEFRGTRTDEALRRITLQAELAPIPSSFGWQTVSIAEPPQFLLWTELLRDKVPSFDSYPFALPVVRSLERIEFHPEVTFIVGETGSGKSTLLEAVAVA